MSNVSNAKAATSSPARDPKRGERVAPLTVLITGVRGKTGREIAAGLMTRPEVTVRGGARDPKLVTAPGVVPVRFDWHDKRTWRDALARVDTLYLVKPQ